MPLEKNLNKVITQELIERFMTTPDGRQRLLWSMHYPMRIQVEALRAGQKAPVGTLIIESYRRVRQAMEPNESIPAEIEAVLQELRQLTNYTGW